MKSYLLKALGISLAMTGFAQDTNQTTNQSTNPPTNCDPTMMHHGEPVMNKCMPSGYNAPCNTMLTQHFWGNWFNNLEVEADFTYWMATQDGMELGWSATEGAAPAGGVVLNNSTQFLSQSQMFKPGFKVGIGGSFQDWKMNARYTWVNNHTNTTQHAPAPATGGVGVWNDTPWVLSSVNPGNGFLRGMANINSSWKLRMDLVDLVSGRPYYQGPAVTVSPFGGLRAAWIRQSFIQQYTPTALGTPAALGSTSFNVNSHSNSWALGPRMGGTGNCLLPMGFRMESTVAANVLFTQYTDISHSEPATIGAPAAINVHMTNVNTVRPSIETAVGFGWGRYLDGSKYHIDFSASYEFQYYWNQNMIATMLDTIPGNGTATTNDLSLQGLTVSGSFDF